MGNHHVGKIKDSWNLMPFRTLYLYHHPDATSFNNLEAESSFRYNALSVKDSKGGNRLLGFNVEIKAYIGHNNYHDVNTESGETMLERIEFLKNNRHDTQIFLGNTSVGLIPSEHRALTVNTTAGLWLDFHKVLRMTYEFESVEFRPRLIITYTGFSPKLF